MQIFEPHHLEAIQDGRFSFAYGINPWLVLAIALALVLLVWFSYRKTTRPLGRGWKTFLITVRSAFLILLLVILLRPIVTVFQVNPQTTYLGVLIDDSQSMSVADMEGGQRRQDVVQQLLYESGGILEPLAENFQIRTFRFDKETQRISDGEELTSGGTASSISQALQHADDQLGGLPLGGLILISDGADNSGTDPVEIARGFAARQTPVFSIGVGQEQIPQDISIVDVSTARTILEGSIFTVEVALSHEGFEGQEIELLIRDGEETAASRRVTLGDAGSTRRFELELTPDRQELIVYDVEVEEQPGEIIGENNRYSFLVDNTEKAALDVLYVEGRPRNEYKFIRRAVEDDDSLRLASYLQTGPGKFYRQGIKNPLELNNGFPETAEELYQYEAVILGDISKDFFSAEQLVLLQDFVAERGGGLLVSGIVEDAFVDSVIADMLPVNLIESTFLPQHLRGGTRRGDHGTGQLYSPRLTRAGEYEPMLRLASGDSENSRIWQEMPELQGVHVTGRPKPGATVLMEHPLLQFQNQALPVMATQRYGSGRSMSINTASTWRWQMFLPSDDETHERLWRQVLRWLTVSALERVTVDFDREFYNVGDQVNVSATVLNAEYEPDNNASLWVQTTDPEGNVTDNPMEWNIDEDGVYQTSFEVENEGVYNLLVDVASAAGSSVSDEIQKNSAFVVTPARREFSRAGQDAALLGRIAQTSGGRYYNVNSARELPSAIEHTPNAYSTRTQEDLWNRGILLALLILLLCVDWIARRLKGLS